MNKSLMAIALAGLFAASAGANNITIYFGRPETVPPTSAFVSDSGGVGLEAPYGTYTLGMWATIQYDPVIESMDISNGIALNIVGSPGVVVSNLVADNHDHAPMAEHYRWESTSDLGGGDNGIFLVSVTRFGLGGLWARQWDMGLGSTDWWSYADGAVGAPDTVYRYWLGNVTLSYNGPAIGNVWFQIGDGGISRQGGSVSSDLIFFGENEPVGMHGNQIEFASSLPDFVFIPEPAALVLIGIGALALRRR